MQRFYLDTELIGNNEIILNDRFIINQIVKVLRLKKGDNIIFFDGKSFFDYIYKIHLINKKDLLFNFVEKIEKNIQNYSLNLYQSFPNKIGKIEEILQKGVEVGYSNFYFFYSKRSQKFSLTESKIVRLKKIIIEALEQSNRNLLPKLFFLDSLNFKNIPGECLFFHTDRKKSIFIKDLKIDFSKIVNIFVGPEGGFTEEENNIFLGNNFKKIFLGNNILRTQTTPTVVGFYLLQNK